MKNANFLHFSEKKNQIHSTSQKRTKHKKIIFADKNFDATPLSNKKDDHW